MLNDLRFALRILRRSPMFTGVAVLSLALGIGANTAIFSVMDALLLRNLPVARPHELVSFGDSLAVGHYTAFPNGNFSALYSIPFYELARRNAQSFSGVAAIESMRADVHARFAGREEAEPLRVRLVSGNYFPVIEARAAVGRVLNEGDTGPVAVISHSLWERKFGRDPNVLGQSLAFNNSAFTIVGVAEREFFGTRVGESPDVWMPLGVQKLVQPWLGDPGAPLSQTLWILARLKPGVTMAAAQSEVDALYLGWLRSLAGPNPSPDRLADMRTAKIRLTDASRGVSELRRQFSEPLRILMALVGLVLLIACANVANLLMARASGRQREIAVRLAIGAGRGRLVQQLLAESLLLATAGGAAGIWVASWGSQLLLAMVSAGPAPVPLSVGPDQRVLLFTVALTAATGLAFGIVPALRLTGFAIAPSLKEAKGTVGNRPRNALARVLVGAQVALALFLMIGAGLFVRTLQRLEGVDPGFDKREVVVVQLDPNSNGSNEPALVSTYRRIIERVRAIPGVERAAYSMLAFDDGVWSMPLWEAGAPQTRANMKNCIGNRVDPDFFAAMGVPIVLGRGFDARDTARAPLVAVVNQTMARTLAPEGSVLGRRYVMGIREKFEFEVVGVVKDARYGNLREKQKAMWYVPNEQQPGLDGFNDLVVRVNGDPKAVMPLVRAAVRSEDPNFGVAQIATLDDLVGRTLGTERLLAKLAGAFGGLALLLAAIGLYGVLAYSVARRTGEIGIRMALGAQSGVVLRMVLGESLGVVAAGIAAGVGAALACGRLVAAQLFGIAPHDAVAIAGATGILFLVALAAAWLPARRAARLDPLATLRE